MHINKEHKNFVIMQKFVLGLEKIIYPWYYISDNNKIQGEVPPGWRIADGARMCTVFIFGERAW